MPLPSAAEREQFIRAYAASIGIDPDVAVKVARSEGLKDGVWQATGQLDYGREQSYGDFQLHNAPAGHRGGLGNEFYKTTGLNPADQANWQAMDKFALDQARKGGWGPWMGAKKVGVTGYEGIGGQPVDYTQPSDTADGTAMGGYAEGPGAVAARNGGLLDPDTDPIMADDGTGSPAATWNDKMMALGKLAKKYADENEQSNEAPLPEGPRVLMTGEWQPVSRKGLLG